MKIGIVQMQMRWTVVQNLTTISGHIKRLGALDVLIFPELALSGFHRNIKAESKEFLIQNAIVELRNLAKKYRTTLFFGAPKVVGSKVFNSYLCISKTGQVVAHWDKAGLTESESLFFAKGGNRSVLDLDGTRCTTVICREVEDADWFISQVRSYSPEIIVWPSYIRQNGNDNTLTGYFSSASEIAKELDAFILQCNWPQALNDQNIRGLGGSRIFGTDGQCLLSMPVDQIATSILEFSKGSLRLVETVSSLETAL
ncbi:carbon-nitrogen hydrolase family protein [Vibrio vulnificus]|uniref:carbon-nitrogen hydrolase family protein n=1 Tax=Vibrio vulnificus TaxID=672 RepID=UPI001A2891D8|nr:carbon-nitrogen hydrolase family protein [Vibrio vulnificus]MCJ0824199.1 carbon-nitrogen hydrolase family protein [Vibrio vulnificus]HAS6212967.1 carbon-nitrogen hydrolase family protein [Vibrio vulnificus]HAS6295345.1 carbon-nitrogen hydrolase family protein [Vibrio vulnificus]HAS6304668.1 carbon-nitrogen hydrolase family protein [Vibrio vulnificus]